MNKGRRAAKFVLGKMSRGNTPKISVLESGFSAATQDTASAPRTVLSLHRIEQYDHFTLYAFVRPATNEFRQAVSTGLAAFEVPRMNQIK